MYLVTIIGHLGANAEVGESNGRKYVRFRVATSKNYTKSDGTKIDSTQWHSCIMSGDGGGLLQYLVKGQAVCVTGNADLGVVSSPKLKKMVATSDVQVQSIELIGGQPDPMPRQLATQDGTLLNVYKCYYISQQEVGEQMPTALYSADGRLFDVTAEGFVTEHIDEREANHKEMQNQYQTS